MSPVAASDRAWGLPKLFSLQADLQKPPLYYWLVAGVAWAKWNRRRVRSAAGGRIGSRLRLVAVWLRCTLRAAARRIDRCVYLGDQHAFHLAGAHWPHRHAADAWRCRLRKLLLPGNNGVSRARRTGRLAVLRRSLSRQRGGIVVERANRSVLPVALDCCPLGSLNEQRGNQDKIKSQRGASFVAWASIGASPWCCCWYRHGSSG